MRQALPRAATPTLRRDLPRAPVRALPGAARRVLPRTPVCVLSRALSRTPWRPPSRAVPRTPGRTPSRALPHTPRRTPFHALPRLAITAIAALTAWLGAARPAAAHPLDIGYLRLTTDGDAITAVLDLHRNAAARLVGVEPAAYDEAAAARTAGALADATLRGAPITGDAGACAWRASAAATVHDTTATVTVEATCPAAVRGVRWDLPFLRDARISPAFQVLVKAQLAGDDRIAIADAARPSLELAALGAPSFAEFVWTGVEHIGAAPSQWRGDRGWKLPDGIDHILFLLALMLAGGSLRRTIGVVSGFTAGHSITLALAALHVVRPPAALIEPLIALTIAFVAAEAFAGRTQGHRWKVAAGFGLIHGFGFASALDQLALPTRDLVRALFGYNLGVELGQIAIVVAAAPAIFLLQRHRIGRPVIRGLAATIFVAGITWFFQRL